MFVTEYYGDLISIILLLLFPREYSLLAVPAAHHSEYGFPLASQCAGRVPGADMAHPPTDNHGLEDGPVKAFDDPYYMSPRRDSRRDYCHRTLFDRCVRCCCLEYELMRAVRDDV